MAIPTNTPIEWRGTTKTLEASGGSITNNALVQANDATYDTSSDGEGTPFGEFALVGTFGTAPAEGRLLSLYARPLDIDGTSDTEAPETTRPTMFVGNFNAVNNVTSAQALFCYVKQNRLPKLAEYFVHNNGTGQTLGSGWTLKVTPYALTPKV